MNQLTTERHKTLLELQSGLTTLIGVLVDQRQPEAIISPRREQLEKLNGLLASYDSPKPVRNAGFGFRDVYRGPAEPKDDCGPVEVIAVPAAMLTPPTGEVRGSLLETLVDEKMEETGLWL